MKLINGASLPAMGPADLEHRYRDRDIRGRFNKAYSRQSSGCWEWVMRKNSDGYGEIKLHGKNELAHRISFVLHGGIIEVGQCVRHKCDNPTCVNPDHLLIGTLTDNRADCVTKKRHARGESQGHSILTSEQVRSIRARYVPYRVTMPMLAEKFGVSVVAIQCIVYRRNWQCV